MKARLFRSANGEWRFTIVAENGEPIAQSEGYERKFDARTIAVQLVGEDNIEAEEAEPA